MSKQVQRRDPRYIKGYRDAQRKADQTIQAHDDLYEVNASLFRLLTAISWIVTCSEGKALVKRLELLAQSEGANPATILALKGMITGRLDVFDGLAKRHIGSYLSELTPEGPQIVETAKRMREALDALHNGNSRPISQLATECNTACLLIDQLRRRINASKGSWAQSDRDYKRIIRDRAGEIVANNPALKGKNTKIGRAIIASLEALPTLEQSESDALYNLRSWGRAARLSREIYDLLKTSPHISEGIPIRLDEP